jgi:hypothetical protein
MDLYTGLPSERKITWQGYANLIKAAWILIDIITRHPQLDFLETSTAYGVELLVEVGKILIIGCGKYVCTILITHMN